MLIPARSTPSSCYGRLAGGHGRGGPGAYQERRTKSDGDRVGDRLRQAGREPS